MYRIAVLASSQIFSSVFKPRTCRASSLKYQAKIPGVKTVADQSGRKIGGQYPEIANHHFITGMEEENEMKNWELTFGISLFETLSFLSPHPNWVYCVADILCYGFINSFAIASNVQKQ